MIFKIVGVQIGFDSDVLSQNNVVLNQNVVGHIRFHIKTKIVNYSETGAIRAKLFNIIFMIG